MLQLNYVETTFAYLGRNIYVRVRTYVVHLFYLSIVGPDALGPGEDVVPDLQDALHGLGDGVLQQGAGLEQGVLEDGLNLVPVKKIC